jgi:hypothetical protein
MANKDVLIVMSALRNQPPPADSEPESMTTLKNNIQKA